MRVLVTGGTGFVGSNLTKRLIEEGHDVEITTFNGEKIPKGVKRIHTDIPSLYYSYDFVFHQAANNNTRDMDRDEMFRANVYEPISMFYNLYHAGCRHFVYASSTAVYGNQPAPYTEDTPVEPLNPYAESKLEFDKFAMNFAKNQRCSVVGLRYCNVYGIGEEHKGSRMSMVSQIYWKARRDEMVQLFKDGNQRRDWVYVKDVVAANMAAMEKTCTGIYNVGSGTSRTFHEVCDVISKEYSQELGIEWIDCPFENQYQNHTECDITKIGLELGWRPKFQLEQGVRDMSFTQVQ